MRVRLRVVVVTLLAVAGLAGSALAQEPPAEPTPLWQGKFGAGLSLTSGNADTSSVNVAFDIVRDPSTRNIIKAHGLLLRGSNDGDVTVNRTTLGMRDEYAYSERMFFYGQVDYLRDTFKEIDYHIAPTAGFGRKLYVTDVALLSADAGAGVVSEKNPGEAVRTSGAVTAGERFELQLSETATLTQSASALWAMDEFGDALYVVGAGLVTSITPRSQLSVEILNTFKNQPPSADVQKNDVAIVTTISYVF